ncbi:MAG: hypothetical protein NVSMB5_02570 [Candidatus Velthaea sp.]
MTQHEFSVLKTGRRKFLSRGAGSVAVAAALVASSATVESAEAVPSASLVDGTTDPVPIPWLDRNASHNQVPGPNQEPAHIFHFTGQVARCNGFRGMGTDGTGRRIRFGGPTTDVGLMQGTYVATDGTLQMGTFLHL